MIMKNKILLFISLAFFTFSANAQQAAYFDPAQAYNRLLIEKGDATYRQISNYKVIGSPYLFGEKNIGDIYSVQESVKGIQLSYNTYNQGIEFFISYGTKVALIKEPGTLDSFVINRSDVTGLSEDLFFIYGAILGSKDKAYYQVVTKGSNFNLYKKYTSELGIVSTNYIQSELRQFNLLVDYFYTGSGNAGINKLKTSPKQLVKEFSAVMDLSSLINVDELTANKELELIRLFQELNKVK